MAAKKVSTVRARSRTSKASTFEDATEPKKTAPGAPMKPKRAASANEASTSRRRHSAATPSPARSTTQSSAPVLLSGGNPQIAKGDGDGPVQAYITAMPEWKSLVGRRIDALVESAVPGVRKAVKWNSPFYGVDGHGWFLSFHCLTKYVKVAFLRGASLVPMPPGESKHQETRYLDIYEGDELDEAQLVTWFKQSAALPGWDGGSPRLNGGIAL